MDIVCCTDANYVVQCGVMLTSLLESNKGCGVMVHVLDNGLTDADRTSLRGIVERKYGQRVAFYALDGKALEAFPDTCSYVSMTAYAKLFIAALLPVTVRKALYLDCDIVVLKPLGGLWGTDLTGKAMAAVKDAHKGIDGDCRRLGVDCASEGYDNSGVMLLNLDYWRAEGVLAECLRFVRDNAGNLPYHDQDVINGVLHGRIAGLPYRYNLHDQLFHCCRFVDPQEFEARVAPDMEPANRVVIHFSSRRKPWGTRCLHPLRGLYFKYLDMTEWCGRRPRYTVKELLWRVNRRLSGCLGWVNGYRKCD